MSNVIGRREVRFDRVFAAPRAKVFALISDHERFGRAASGGMRLIRLKRVGTDLHEPNGVGSVRRIARGPLAFEETVTRFVRDELIEYTVSRGSPLKNHLGHIEFSDVPEGTRMQWTIRFDPKIPGTGPLVAAVLSAILNSGFSRIARTFAQS